MQMGDSPGMRLAAFRKTLGAGQRAFGASLGVSGSFVAQIETNRQLPTQRFLTALSDVYGINADWLLNGHGEKMRFPGQGFAGRVEQVEPPDQSRPGHGDVRFGNADYVFVKRMALSVSAGSGLIPVDNGATERMALPTGWFERQGINSDLAVMVTVSGDSMSPAIPDGCLVLVHVAEKMPTKPGIYAFNFDGQSFVKRIIPSGADRKGRPVAITLVSDNPVYPPRTLTGEDMNSIAVVGRVRAVFATL